MIRRGELTDEAWAWVEPLLLEGGRRGGRWLEHRTVTNGILWKLRTGAPWRVLPERDGTWERLLAHAQTRLDAVGNPGGSLWLDVEAFEDAAATARRGRDPAAYRAAIELNTGDL